MLNFNNIKSIAEYMNTELAKGRSQKDIEINDFKVNEKVIKNRLSRAGYKKINNQWIFNTTKYNTNCSMNNTPNTTIDNTNCSTNTTNHTTEILQPKNISKDPKVFTNKEIETINKLLNLNVDILELIIDEYSKRNNKKVEITDNSAIITSLRLNKEIYTLIKEKAQIEGLNVYEIMNNCMLEYLNK